MQPRLLKALIWLCLLAPCSSRPALVEDAGLERSFASTVQPFLQTYCFQCHNADKQKGKLDLSSYSDVPSIASDFRRWEIVSGKIKEEEMPPEEARKQPSPESRREITEWIAALRKREGRRNAGDPGTVLAHRLSNAEYDYTIRDLTGVDLHPAREFPVDPANEAGFDNSGESLSMSPALLKKYLEAARTIAEHVVLKPDGFVFAPESAVTETDRDKYCVKRIIEFYQRQPTNYANYFASAWKFKNREALGRPEISLGQVAAEDRVSPKYVAMLWSILEAPPQEIGPIAALHSLWRELPKASGKDGPPPQEQCERMGRFVVKVRHGVTNAVENLRIRGIADGSQPFVLWKDRQLAESRLRYGGGALKTNESGAGDPAPGALAERAMRLPENEADRKKYENSFERFCKIFPDAFYLSERGLVFLKEDKESKGRLLSAGFHLMTGYFRDDAPLYNLILNEAEQHELDRLWQEFNFITLAPIRQYKDFIFFERAEPPRFMFGSEFDFARSEDKDAISDAKIKQLEEAYVAKAKRNGGDGAPIEAIEDFFKRIGAEIRAVEASRLAAEPNQLKELLEFAQRAYRRPLQENEREEVLGFYRAAREREGLGHEDAMRESIVAILMSPEFLYRTLSAAGIASSGDSASTPLSDYSLANRLSYFVWSSMPDAELLGHAAAGDLHREDVLLAQTRRMLKDTRVLGLVTEFGGNWLDFRRFEEHNSVDRERFKSFDNELREAMFQEPIHFLLEMMQEDRPVLDLIYGDYTFVNPSLARHYRMPVSTSTNSTGEWTRIANASAYGRGGLLPMAVFLTKNSPGLRTSPVKRGYWVVRRLLGEYIPPPPPKVPELPTDEAKLELPLRETLERHRADKSCAACHAHFDSMGLVFEKYGPIGELREKDLAGHAVDARAPFPDGVDRTGLDGLRQYLKARRQQDFLEHLCRSMLSYALGRTLILTDDPLIEEMEGKLAASDYRFSSLIEAIVTSRQFLNVRPPRDGAESGRVSSVQP